MGLRPLLVMALTCAQLVAGRNSPEASSCGLLLIDDSLVAFQRNLQLESHYHPRMGSFARHNPKTYQRVLDLFQEYPSAEAFFSPKKGESYESMLTQIREGGFLISQRLEMIAKTMKATDEKLIDFKKLLLDMAIAFSIKPPMGAGDFVGRLDWLKYTNLSKSLAGKVLDGRRTTHFQALVKFGSYIYALWAELRVAMMVPNFRFRQVHLRTLSGLGRSFHDAVESLTEGEQTCEVDLVWQTNKSHAWGEVKAFLFPLRLSQSRRSSFGQVSRQLKRQRQLSAKLGLSVERYVFFVNGITQEAKNALQTEGFTVFGPVREAVDFEDSLEYFARFAAGTSVPG